MPRKDTKFVLKYGPWALITGGSDGIGQALAIEAAARGLHICLVARRREALQVVAKEIESKFGVETYVIVADLGTAQGVEAVLHAIDGKEIGLFAACAGFGTSGHFIESDLETELNMVDVNCRAVAWIGHVLAADMKDRRRGGLIFMSSIVAFQGVANAAHYAATKAYIQSLAEGLAAELKPFGVDVLAAAPGPVRSGFAARADMTMGGAATPSTVAKGTLKALGQQITVRPGLLSKLLGYNLAILPRPLRKRIMGQIMKGMANPQHDPNANQIAQP